MSLKNLIRTVLFFFIVFISTSCKNKLKTLEENDFEKNLTRVTSRKSLNNPLNTRALDSMKITYRSIGQEGYNLTKEIEVKNREVVERFVIVGNVNPYSINIDTIVLKGGTKDYYLAPVNNFALNFSEYVNQSIRFVDISFDTHPDIVINSSSSEKENPMKNVFIYNRDGDFYEWNEFLSEQGNIEIDSIKKILTTLWSTSITDYQFAVYRFENNQPVEIKRKRQDYNMALNALITRVDSLTKKGWSLKIDTIKIL